jgi:hypothetical protein
LEGKKKKNLVIIGLKECRTPNCRPLSGAREKKSPNFRNHKIGKKKLKKFENTLVIIGLKEGPFGALTRL